MSDRSRPRARMLLRQRDRLRQCGRVRHCGCGETLADAVSLKTREVRERGRDGGHVARVVRQCTRLAQRIRLWQRQGGVECRATSGILVAGARRCKATRRGRAHQARAGSRGRAVVRKYLRHTRQQ